MKINNHIVLDFNKTKQVNTQTIQCDMKSRFVRVSLRHNNSPIDLSDVRVCIMAVKPDGKEIFNDCTVIDAQNGIAEFEITKQMGIVVGEVECQIKLFGKEKLLSSNIFNLSVSKSLSPNSRDSKDQLNTLVNALGEVQDINNRFNKINYKIDENYQKVNAQLSQIKVFIKDFGAKGDGATDDTLAVESAMDYLESIGGGVLVFTKGTYRLNYFLLRENTSVEITPNAILKSVTGVLCSNFLSDEIDTVKYEGRSNIKIYGGGTIDMNAMEHQSSGTVVQFGHCSDIHIENIIFKNIADDHAIEFVGVKDFEVKKCKFMGYKDFKNDGSKKYKEAIQIDFCLPNHGGGGQTDSTPCVNGVIDGCEFDLASNMEYFPSAIGSHGVNVTKKCDNIVVKNCVIKGCKDAGIFAFNWTNSTIENNKIFNSDGFGVVVEFCDNVTVKTNLVDTAVDGICIYDSNNIREEQNVIKNTQKHGSHIKKTTSEIYVINNVFKNNNLSNETFSAIAIGSDDNDGDTTDVEISGNKIISDNDFLAYGIDVRPNTERINYDNNCIYAKVKNNQINDRQRNNGIFGNRTTLFSGDIYATNVRNDIPYSLDNFDEYEFTVNGNGIECRRFLATELHPKVRVFNLTDSNTDIAVNFYEMNIDMNNNYFTISNNVSLYWNGTTIVKTNANDGSGMRLLKIVGIRYNSNKIAN